MNPTKIRCPHCGNSILIKQSGKSVCPSCHTPLYIEEKDKSVNVNVNLARAERSEAKIKGVFLFLIVLLAMSSMLILLLPRLFRAGEKVQRTVAPKYKESISDPVLTRLFAEAFEKDSASFTEEDYQRVKTISFRKETSQLLRVLWVQIGFTDDSTKIIPLVSDYNMIKIDGIDFQAFPNLEGIYVSGAADAVSLTFESEEYAHTLANLTKLKCLQVSDYSRIDQTPKALAAFVADPAQIEELIGVSLRDTEDVDNLAKYFPNLKRLAISYRGAGVSLAGLKQLSQLEVLATELNADGNEDLLELTDIREMQLLARADGEPVKDFRFLSSLTQLKSLTLISADELRSLNALSPLTELEELRIYGGRELHSIEPLRALTALRVLDLGDSTKLENLDALQSLTALKRLRLTNSSWGSDAIPPDLSMLTSLEEAEIEEDSFASVAACRSLKKLTLYLNQSSHTGDFSQLAGLENLESLRLELSSSWHTYLNIESLSKLPKLNKLTVVGRNGPLPLNAFPQVKEIVMIGETLNGGAAKAVITPGSERENTALESLTLIGYGGVEISDHRDEYSNSEALGFLSAYTALRELRLNHCDLSDLSFVDTIPNAEFLDISGNRIEDISPLTALPKLRTLICSDNEIQNIGVLQDRGIVMVE